MERRAASPSRPTRRTALAGSAAALAGAATLAGCARGGVRAPLPPPTRQERLDERLRLQAVADERRLLAAYAATAARHPSLAALLAVPQAHHAQHLARLSPPAATPTATPTETPTATPTAVAAPVPADPRTALAALSSAELSAAAARRTGCAQVSAVLAPLLASVGAAEAVHAALLAGGGP